MDKERRRKIIVDPKLQYSLVSCFLFLFVLASAIYHATLSFAFLEFHSITETLQLAPEHQVFSDLVPIIDIDGQDYWLWHDLRRFRPRVMLVEIFPHDSGKPVPERGAGPEHQSGLDGIEQLGTEKGYTLVATTHCNALFIETVELENAGRKA